MVAEAVFPAPVMEHMAHWLSVFSKEWHSEVPLKIHVAQLDRSGTPRWSPEFAQWISGKQRGPNPDRFRITTAMRNLRRVSPRQYEVLYRIMVLGESIESTTNWLNARAIRGGHPERYRRGDTLAILQSSIDWVEHHY